MAKKTKVNDKIKTLKQVDGMVRVAESCEPIKLNTKIRSLDEVFGFSGSTYPTLNEAEYFTSIAGMNKVDLQKESVRIGLIPHEDRRVMEERLMREFKRTMLSYKVSETRPINLSVSRKAKDILSEGANRPG